MISSAVMDVGQRLSMVCTRRSPSLRMVPPTTVSGLKYSSAVAMPTPAPVVSDTRLCNQLEELTLLLVAQTFSQQVVRQQHDGGDTALGARQRAFTPTASTRAVPSPASATVDVRLGAGQRRHPLFGAHDSPRFAVGTALVTTPAGDIQDYRIGDSALVMQPS